MDLLLIRPNDKKAVYGDTYKYVACEPPYWAGVIASYVKNNGFSVEILDAEAVNASPDDMVNLIVQKRPGLIGVCVTGTNLSASTQKMNGAGLLCCSIREAVPTIPIFMWGLHPSALPEQTMMEEKIDFVIKGEGLRSIVRLTEYIKTGGGSRVSLPV